MDSCTPAAMSRGRSASLVAGMIVALPRSAGISITACAAVRAFACQLGQRRTDDACLLVSELVTNAYRHGHGEIRLTISLHDHVARFAVHDDGNATLRPSAHPGEHGGFGLMIVDRVADRWGTSSAPTNVWCELHAPQDAHHPDRRLAHARRRTAPL